MSLSISPSGASAPGVAASQAPKPAAHVPEFDDETLVLHIDYFILAIFAVFALLTIPRLVARYSRRSEWSLGHLLRAVPYTTSFTLRRGNSLARSPTRIRYQKSTESLGTEESSTLNSHLNMVQHETKLRQVSLPSQPRSFSAMFHPVTVVLGHPIMPGYSIGRLVIMLGYFFTLLYATVYKSSPFSDPKRAGFISMSQLPIVFALGTKNNILGMVLSVGYEKVRSLSPAVVFRQLMNNAAQLLAPICGQAHCACCDHTCVGLLYAFILLY